MDTEHSSPNRGFVLFDFTGGSMDEAGDAPAGHDRCLAIETLVNGLPQSMSSRHLLDFLAGQQDTEGVGRTRAWASVCTVQKRAVDVGVGAFA